MAPPKKMIKKASTKKPASKISAAKKVTAEIVDDSAENPELSHEEQSSSHLPDLGDAHDDIVIEATQEVPLLSSERSVAASDPLAMYLSEIRKYKILTKEEELKIAKKYYDSKDPQAAEALVKANLRFVVKVAAEYSKFGAKMIDLIQEGNVGLMHAVREFNPYKGARLITYAVWWIRGYIQEFLMRQYSMVRIGTTQNQRKLFYQLQKQKEALDAMGIEPNVALISSRLGIPEDEVQDMALRLQGRDLSLDAPLDGESGKSLGDLQKTPSSENLEDTLAFQEQLGILSEIIQELRPQLNEREIILLDERILNEEPLTLQEIGEKYKITREAVRQAEARLMKKIKDKMEEKTGSK